MLSTLFNAGVLALMASGMASAQSSSKCNPYKGESCDPDPAFGDTEVTVDFTQGESDVFTLANGTSLTYDSTNGAVFSVSSETDAPTAVSNKYLFFGRVDCVVQAAPGTGIVTSFTLQSDDLDEIDWEWVGSDTGNSQSNYFGKGDTTTYDRGAYHATTDVTTEFHTYSIEWTSSSLQWIIDGTTVRTLNYADAENGTRYPQTPMQVRLGTWVGGSSTASEGTIEWAGGLATFDGATYKGYYKNITIKDYANGVSGAKEYIYGDSSGDFSSIEVVTADGTVDNTSTSTSKDISTTTTATATGATTAATTTGSGDSAATTTMTTSTKSDSNAAASSSSNSTSTSETSTSTVGSSAAVAVIPPHTPSAFFAAVVLVLGTMIF